MLATLCKLVEVQRSCWRSFGSEYYSW